MWPLKSHYVLWFGSLSGILPFVPVFAKIHLNVSATEVGILFCIVPFIVSIGKPVACSIADHHGRHSKTLLAAQFLTLFSYGIMIIIPFLIDYMSKTILWIFFCALCFIANVSMGIGTSLTDYLVINEVNLINQNGGNTNYGNFRIWGTVGFGIFGILSGVINDISKHLPYLIPGLCLYIAIECMDIAYVYYFFHKPRQDAAALVEVQTSDSLNNEVKRFVYNSIEPNYSDSTKQKKKSISFNERIGKLKKKIGYVCITFKQIYHLYKVYPSLIQHTFIVFCFGILTAFHWSFFFWFLEDIRGKDSLLMGLCIFVNSFVGEIPIFLVAHKFIQWIGPILSFCVALAAFALRFFAYGYWLDVQIPGSYWDILLIETLQGLTFSLFYTVMTHVAMKYASQCDELFLPETTVKLTKPQVENTFKYSLEASQESSIDDEAEGQIESEQSGHLKMNSLRSSSGVESIQNDEADKDLNESKPPKLSATMQGLMSACYEGIGLGVGSLIGGQLIENVSKFAIWRFAAMFSVGLIVFNVLIEIIKFYARKNNMKTSKKSALNENSSLNA